MMKLYLAVGFLVFLLVVWLYLRSGDGDEESGEEEGPAPGLPDDDDDVPDTSEEYTIIQNE